MSTHRSDGPGVAVARPWRAFGRAVLLEGRAARGRLVFFIGALSVGVAAVVGVAALVGAFEAGLRSESRTLLGGDLRAEARRPLPDSVKTALDDLPHARADLRELAATASQGDRSRLVELKVISGGFPFAGELTLEPVDFPVRELDGEGVVVAPDLAASLGAEIGDEILLGGATFQLRALVVDEPDRIGFQMSLGPRAILSAEGFARTDLEGLTSRARYLSVWSFAEDYDAARLAELKERLESAVDEPEFLRVQSHTEAQPSIRRSLVQVEKFLGLVALLSLLLGGLGVSQIVRAWLAGRTQAVAVLRCLGLRAREIAVLYLGNVMLLALIGSAFGALAGMLVPIGVRALAPDLFAGPGTTLIQPLAALRGAGLGVAVAVLFSLPSLTTVWSVAPAVALRAESAPLPVPRSVRWLAPLAVALGLVSVARLQGGSWLEALAFTGGLALLALVLWGGAWLLSWLVARVPRGRIPATLSHGLASLARPGAGTTGAIVALGLGVLVVVSMGLVAGGLRRELQESLPEDAPSVFLLDVQPDQWEAVREDLSEVGARAVGTAPVAMGRLRAIDGVPVKDLIEGRRDAGRAAWMFTRELRMTWLEELAPDNEIIDGELWSNPDEFELSVEVEFARSMGVEVGSRVRIDVQGIAVDLLVTSLRTVEWQSFDINFFLVVEPGALEGAPHFRLAVARIEPPEREMELQTELAGSVPNVTMLRVRPLLEALGVLVARITAGVRGLGAFTIVTGLVILAGSVATSALRRGREAALLKSLGVTRGGVARLFAVEFALVGLVAGLIGSLGAVILAQVFLTQVADVAAAVEWSAIGYSTLGTVVLAVAAGLLASRKPLSAPPADTLRG